MSASTNPVYVRLTRHAGWPSEPTKLRNQIAAAMYAALPIGGAAIMLRYAGRMAKK